MSMETETSVGVEYLVFEARHVNLLIKSLREIFLSLSSFLTIVFSIKNE